MNYLKKIGISLGIGFPLFFIFIFLLTLLEYINFISPTTKNIFFILFILASFLISGFILGKKSLKKGWLEGIKLSIIEIIIFMCINLVFKNWQIKSIVFYLLIFISTTFGSMLGVTKRKN